MAQTANFRQADLLPLSPNENHMEKTLHILPSEYVWPLIVEKWIGDGPDKADHELLPYPLDTSMHYLPESLTDAEMMRTALSFEKAPAIPPLSDVFANLQHFAATVRNGKQYDKVIVWRDEYADSRLLLCMIANTYSHRIYTVDVTPVDRRCATEPEPDEPEEDIEPPLYSHLDVDRSRITRNSFTPKIFTREQRKECKEAWLHWGGEDAGDCPILVNQYGKFFHVHRTYLYKAIFLATNKYEPRTTDEICKQVFLLHPQIHYFYIYETLLKMSHEGMLKRTKVVMANYTKDEFQQYKHDVEGEWIAWDRDFVYQFIDRCGKKIKMSEDDLKAEYLRDRKDYEDMWGHGHLARAQKRASRQEWKDRNVVRWAAALNADWGWYHLLSVVRTKLEMMSEYMRDWSPIANGPVYSDQMRRTIALIDIILDWGGRIDEGPRHVNFRNRRRIPSPNYDGHHFDTESQRLRFDKAWHLLWETFRTQLLTWDD